MSVGTNIMSKYSNIPSVVRKRLRERYERRERDMIRGAARGVSAKHSYSTTNSRLPSSNRGFRRWFIFTSGDVMCILPSLAVPTFNFYLFNPSSMVSNLRVVFSATVYNRNAKF